MPIAGNMTNIRLCLFSAFFFIQLFSSIIHTVIIGADIGTQYLKLASALPGRSFSVILNAHSQRKTPTAISFINDIKNHGDSALGNSIKHPHNVITSLPIFLGKTEEEVKSLLNEFTPWNISKSNTSQAIIQFPSSNLNLTFEQAFAHLLRSIQTDINRFYSPKTKLKYDFVLSIPESFAYKEKKALLNAANLADVNVLKFVSEVPSAAVYHAVDLPSNFTGNKLVIDVGAWRSQACVMSYNITTSKGTQRIRTINTIRCNESDKVGGLHFTYDLAKHAIKQAKNLFGPKAESRITLPKLLQRFLKEAEHTKLILSTNKQSKFKIEDAYNDKDFDMDITREKFEELIAPRVQIMQNMIEKTIQTAKIDLSELSGVELIGGSSRVPVVYQKIDEIVKPLTVGHHLNSDEASVLGNIFIAANVSSIFRVKPMHFTPHFNAEYTLTAIQPTSDLNDTVRKIAKIGDPITAGTRVFFFKTCNDLQLELTETKPDSAPSTIFKINLTGISENCEGKYKEFGIPKVGFIVKIENTGLITPERAVARWEETYYVNETVIATKNDTNIKLLHDEFNQTNLNQTNLNQTNLNQTNLNQTNLNQTDLNQTDSKQTDSKQTDSKQTDSKQTDSSTKRSEKDSELKQTDDIEEKLVQVEKKRKHTVPCNITIEEVMVPKLEKTYWEEIQKSFQDIENSSELAMKQRQILNELEELLYSTRSRLQENNELFLVSTDKFRTSAEKELESLEDWLEVEGTAANYQTLSEKMYAFNEFFAQANFKADEYKKRNTFDIHIQQLSNSYLSDFLPLVNTQITIPQGSLEKYNETYYSFISWYTEQKEKQDKLPLYEIPVLKASEVEKKLADLTVDLQSLLKSAKKTVNQNVPSKITNNETVIMHNKTETNETTSTTQATTKKTEASDSLKTAEPNVSNDEL